MYWYQPILPQQALAHLCGRQPSRAAWLLFRHRLSRLPPQLPKCKFALCHPYIDFLYHLPSPACADSP